MKIRLRINGVITEADPNSVQIEIDDQRFQLTQYLNYLKVVKFDSNESDNMTIQPCVANSILIK